MLPTLRIRVKRTGVAGTSVERSVYVLLGLGFVALTGLAVMPLYLIPVPAPPRPPIIAAPLDQTVLVVPPSTRVGEVRENPSDGLRYVWIPSGTFQMGCSPGDDACAADEKPPHAVTITKGFWLGQTEVTVGAYKRFANTTGRSMPPEQVLFEHKFNPGWNDEMQPIVNVTQEDAAAYCQWAGGRLPTEAEWEYAARAGTAERFYSEPGSIAWYADNSGRERIDSSAIEQQGRTDHLRRLLENDNRPHPVAQKPPNSFGLYDMLGNVWEWVADWYESSYYAASAPQDPQGPTGGEKRVLRGGSWYDSPDGVRVSKRGWSSPGDRSEIGGFRCAREVTP